MPFRIPDAIDQQALFIAPFVLDPNESQPAPGRRPVAVAHRTTRKTPNTPDAGPTLAGDQAQRRRHRSARIAVAPGDSDIVWVGHDDGMVFRTDNGTAATPIWQRVDATGRAAAAAAAATAPASPIDPTDADTVYVDLRRLRAGQRLDDHATAARPGPTSAAALPAAPVRALAVHPRRTRASSTSAPRSGVFASEDGGATWSPTNEGPTNCSVDDLFWMGETLVCATHGRGMFQIDLSTL